MQGYKVLKNVIPSTYLKIAQKETLRLKTWLLKENLLGTRSELGTGEYWRGIETAAVMQIGSMRSAVLHLQALLWAGGRAPTSSV